eukprot:Em0001g1785a
MHSGQGLHIVEPDGSVNGCGPGGRRHIAAVFRMMKPVWSSLATAPPEFATAIHEKFAKRLKKGDANVGFGHFLHCLDPKTPCNELANPPADVLSTIEAKLEIQADMAGYWATKMSVAPELAIVVTSLLSLVPTEACVERSFSKQKALFRPRRAAMSIDTVNSHLFIQMNFAMHGPPDMLAALHSMEVAPSSSVCGFGRSRVRFRQF